MHTPTEYAVFFTGPDNGPAFRRVGSLEEAVQVVEHLRNELGVVDANVHSLAPVPLSFRTYYRVEVPGQAEAPVAEATHVDALPAYQPSYEPSYEPADPFGAQAVQVSFASDLDARWWPTVTTASPWPRSTPRCPSPRATRPLPRSGGTARSRYENEERGGRMGFFAR